MKRHLCTRVLRPVNLILAEAEPSSDPDINGPLQGIIEGLDGHVVQLAKLCRELREQGTQSKPEEHTHTHTQSNGKEEPKGKQS